MSLSARTAKTAAATAIVLALTATAATAAPPPKALTHKYPLGTQTICCHSHTVTTIRPTAPAQSSKPTNPRPAKPHKHASHGGMALWLVIAVVVLLGLAFLAADWLTMRRSHRVAPRKRREVPRALLTALKPIFRYDPERDAWILRVRGERYGPVLAAPGYHAKHPDEDGEPAPAPDTPKTPDPFEPRPAAARPRPHRDDRPEAARAEREREPPPLPIRPRPK